MSNKTKKSPAKQKPFPKVLYASWREQGTTDEFVATYNTPEECFDEVGQKLAVAKYVLQEVRPMASKAVVGS